MTKRPRLTDREALEMHRARARRAPELFLFEEAAVDLEERLSEVKKEFTRTAIVGGLLDPFLPALPSAECFSDSETLDLERARYDLVLHAMALHWSDDPVGQLVQSRLALKPDGLFLCVFFGGQTLHELRSSLADAESRLKGGLSPRVLPMGDLRDLGGLLQRAGFALPVADSRTVVVRYPSIAKLVRDLRGMGETNALEGRLKAPMSRKLISELETVYRHNFSDSDGYLKATFEIVTLTGWAPADSQPKPLRPGSATHRLADALNTDERPAGDKSAPN